MTAHSVHAELAVPYVAVADDDDNSEDDDDDEDDDDEAFDLRA